MADKISLSFSQEFASDPSSELDEPSSHHRTLLV